VTGERTRERIATTDRNFFMGETPLGVELEQVDKFFKIGWSWIFYI